MRGTFHSLGGVYTRCPISAESERRKAQEFRTRVVGRRVVVVDGMDFGKRGTVVDVNDHRDLGVRLDFDATQVLWFSRDELQGAK